MAKELLICSCVHGFLESELYFPEYFLRQGLCYVTQAGLMITVMLYHAWLPDMVI
jgi:hypothetical protein